MPREPINYAPYHVKVDGFSQAVKIKAEGTLLFISGTLTKRSPVTGQVAWYGEPAIVEAEGDVEAQTRNIMESIKGILAEAGGTLDDVVRIVVYLTDMDTYPAMHKVRQEYFGDEPPASTCIEVSRLFDDRRLIEIEATALIPSTRS